MAMKLNPLTGMMEDDGTSDLLVDPNQPADAPAVPSNLTHAVEPGGAGGATNITVSPPPEQSKTVDTSTQTVPTPAIKQGLEEHGAASKDVVSSTIDKAAADANQQLVENKAESDEAGNILKLEQQKQKDQVAALTQYDKDRAAAAERLRAAQQAETAAYENTRKDYWADKPWGMKVLSSVLVASSRRNHRILGEDPNNSYVQKTVETALAEDKAQKLKDYVKSKEFKAAAAGGAAAAKAAYDEKIGQIDASHSQSLKIAAAEASALKKSAKVDPAAVDANANLLIATARQKEAEASVRLQTPFAPKKSHSRTEVDKAGDGKNDKQGVNVGGKEFQARGTPAEAGRLRTKAGATATLNGLLDEYDQLLSKGANPATTGEERAEIQSKLGSITAKIKESEELGALDNGVQNLVKGMIGDPTALSSIFSGGAEGARRKVRVTKDAAQKSLEETLIAHGNDPAIVRKAVRGGSTAASSGPAEGDEKKLSDGTPIVFRGGKWEPK